MLVPGINESFLDATLSLLNRKATGAITEVDQRRKGSPGSVAFHLCEEPVHRQFTISIHVWRSWRESVMNKGTSIPVCHWEAVAAALHREIDDQLPCNVSRKVLGAAGQSGKFRVHFMIKPCTLYILTSIALAPWAWISKQGQTAYI